MEDILGKYSFKQKEAVLVGDAESDRVAAESTGVFFVARISLESQLEDCRWKINDLTELF